LFPAFWVEPIETFTKIFISSYKVGNELGHKQIFFGEMVRNPGPIFYPILLVLKVSMLTIVGFFIYMVSQLINLAKNRKVNPKEISFELFIAIFYIGYFLVITWFSKKVDRYPVSLYPFFGIIAVLGYSKLKFKKGLIVAVLAGYTIVYPLIRAFPHYMAVNNPILGDASKGNEIIGQKLFGIGVFDLREHILEKYGRVSVAMNDHDTLGSIYGPDLVYDISSTHPNSYKLIILGPNKDFPPSVKNTGIRFTKRSSVYINGLEFWRIYKERGH